MSISVVSPGVQKVSRLLAHHLLISLDVTDHCDIPGRADEWLTVDDVTDILRRRGALAVIEDTLDDVILLIASRQRDAHA